MMPDSTTSRLGRLDPSTLAIVLGLAAVALNLILVIGAALRWQAAEATKEQITTIEANISQLDALETAEIESLQTQLAELEVVISETEAEIPDPTAPFPTYEQAYQLALERGAQLLEIRREGVESRPTVLGEIDTEVYSLLLSASPAVCLEYVGQLEREGGPGLATDGISIDREVGACAFDLFSVARAVDES